MVSDGSCTIYSDKVTFLALTGPVSVCCRSDCSLVRPFFRRPRHSCGLHGVAQLMRQASFRACPKRTDPPKDQGTRSITAANVLEREFEAVGPNQKWVADFTYVWTADGWLYVVAVIDLCSRRVVSWWMGDQMTSQMVTDALIMAIWRRCRPKELLHHSDQRSQYTSD